jgi:hypothetical protein
LFEFSPDSFVDLFKKLLAIKLFHIFATLGPEEVLILEERLKWAIKLTFTSNPNFKCRRRRPIQSAKKFQMKMTSNGNRLNQIKSAISQHPLDISQMKKTSKENDPKY